jgi:NAD(P)H-hydrate repair Nnr-like enzyme with NAD(P)H-hydrate dehydratase domain
MIGALMARGLDATAAAVSGAYWHGKAASSLAATGTVTASRLVDSVGRHAW